MQLSKLQCDFFDSNGYLVLKDFLTKEICDQLKERIYFLIHKNQERVALANHLGNEALNLQLNAQRDTFFADKRKAVNETFSGPLGEMLHTFNTPSSKGPE